MPKVTVLFKSTIEAGKIKNQVIGQVPNPTKADKIVSDFTASSGLTDVLVEKDADGVTKSAEVDGQKTAFSSFVKSSI